MNTPSIDDMTPTGIAAGIHAHAIGDPCAEAATNLLGHHHGLLGRREFRQFCTPTDEGTIEVNWNQLAANMPGFSSGEKNLLLIAASLATGRVRVNLRNVLTGFDEHNEGLVENALVDVVRGGRS